MILKMSHHLRFVLGIENHATQLFEHGTFGRRIIGQTDDGETVRTRDPATTDTLEVFTHFRHGTRSDGAWEHILTCVNVGKNWM